MSWVSPSTGHHIPAVLPPPLLPFLQAVGRSAVRTRWCSPRALLLVKADSIRILPAKNIGISVLSFVNLLHSTVFHLLHLMFGGMAASVLESLISCSDIIEILVVALYYCINLLLPLYPCFFFCCRQKLTELELGFISVI